MFIVLIRTIFLYFLVILVMRLMGKRQIGELQPYEFVITIMISDLALRFLAGKRKMFCI